MLCVDHDNVMSVCASCARALECKNKKRKTSALDVRVQIPLSHCIPPPLSCAHTTIWHSNITKDFYPLLVLGFSFCLEDGFLFISFLFVRSYFVLCIGYSNANATMLISERDTNQV